MTTPLDTYTFPSARLRRTLSDPAKTPLVLVACGSFSPITHMHLRMFEMAVDYVKQNMLATHEVVGGYLSPVSDRYNKAGLASALHRVRMCELACNEASSWLMVDPWEAIQPDYQPTAVVLDHFAHSINTLLGGISGGIPARIMLLGGSDLLQTMSQPGVWSPADLAHILGDYGLLVVERNGTDVSEALAPLARWQDNIWIVRQLIANDISSTRIRQLIRQGMSVRYLLPGVVVDYIREHRLYGEHEEFKETRSSSMPPLCRAEGKGACVSGAAGVGVGVEVGRGLQVPRPAQMARCVSAQREMTPSKMREEMSADGDGGGGVDGATQTEEEDTRGRRPSS